MYAFLKFTNAKIKMKRNIRNVEVEKERVRKEKKIFIIIGIVFIYSFFAVLNEKNIWIPFPFSLVFQVSKTLVNAVFYLLVFCPLHSIRLILLSFPNPSGQFYERYNIDIATPFNRLIPIMQKVFPLFIVQPKICDFISGICQNLMSFSIISILFLFVKNIILSIILILLVLYLDENTNFFDEFKLKHIFCVIFIMFLILYKWTEVKGPFYEPINKLLTIIKDFHLKILYFIIGPKIDDKDRKMPSLLHVPVYIFRLCAHQFIKAIRYIHPHSFDPLCEYIILSIIWTGIFILFLLLLVILEIALNRICILYDKFKLKQSKKIPTANPRKRPESTEITDIKQNVINQGGNVTGCLRFSIQWNDTGVHDESDLDAHCTEPSIEISHANLTSQKTGGKLNLDTRTANIGVVACENITWPDINRMEDGIYRLYVHQFNAKNSCGFKADIEFGGTKYYYEYKQPLPNNINVDVAYVTVKNKKLSIKHSLPYKLKHS